MATRYPLSALTFPCVTMLWLSSQMPVSLTTAAGSKHMAILDNVNCTLPFDCIPDRKKADKFYRLVAIADTIMEVTRPSTNNKLQNISNSRNRNVLYPETPVNTTNSSIMLFRMDKQGFTGEKVTSAVLKIYIKTKGKRRRRRIILHVSENTEDGKLAEFATIKLRVKRKGWQKINLPIYLLKKLQHQPIKLHVGCEKCNKKVRVVLPLKKSKKSQEFRDLGSRKRRSPMIVLNTKPNPSATAAAAAAAAAAVAAAVTTHHLRRPRRDVFRFGSKNPVLDTVAPIVEQKIVKINTDSAEQLPLRLINTAGVDKSPTIVQSKEPVAQYVDKGTRDVSKRCKTMGSACAEKGDNNVKDEEKLPADEYDDDNDDDDESSSFDGANDNDDIEDDDDDYDDDYDSINDSVDEAVDDGEAMENYDDVLEEENGLGEGLSEGCCMRSRFVSFRSIGLSGLVVRPRLGFVNNQCSNICPTGHLQTDLGVVVATHETNPHSNKPEEVADSDQPKYNEQPNTRPITFEKKDRKSLLDKFKINRNPKYNSEEPRNRHSTPFLLHLRQAKRQHPSQDGKHRMHYAHQNRHHGGQNVNDRLRAIRNGNTVSNKNRKRRTEKDKNNYKNLPLRRSCRPAKYKNLKLSFITADLKVEKMTLPNAIVSKCVYV